MIRSVLAFSMLVLAAGAQAQAATQFSCSNVGGTEEWTIYVDLEKKLAGFFDNDTTVVVPLKDIHFFDTLPRQTEYVFEGEDESGRNGSRVRIYFNESEMSASITLNLGERDEFTIDSKNGCKADKISIDLED